MKSIKKLVLIVVILVISNECYNVFGQNGNSGSSKVGIGVSFFNLGDVLFNSDNGGYTSSIYIPINVSEQFRIEPEIGFISTKNSDYYKNTDFYNIGFGFFKLSESKDLLLKYGVRVGTWSNDFYHISPTIGGEYFLSQKFSLGAEAQLKLVFHNSQTTFLTGTSVSVRFYFN